MNIKVFKIGYFSFTFKLNEKKKVPVKKFSLERGVTRKYFLEDGVCSLIGALEMFPKKGG